MQINAHTVESLRNKVAEAAKVIEAVPAVVEMLEHADGADLADMGASNDEPEIKAVSRFVIWKRLAALGIYEDEESHGLLMSPECSEGEARRAFCENGNPQIPPIRFKKVWSILRENAESYEVAGSKSDIEKLIDANKPVAEWKDDRLIEEYNSDNDLVIQELMKRSHGRPFVAYMAVGNDNNVLDKPLTLEMLKVARKRDTDRKIKKDRVLYLLRKADEFPGQIEEVCPIHGTVLTQDYCAECSESWDGVSYEARQFIRVMCDEDEGPKSKLELKAIISLAKEGINKLTDEFADVYVIYDRLRNRSELPSLKLDENEGPKDPFRPGGRLY